MKTPNHIWSKVFKTAASLIVFSMGLIQSGYGAGLTIVTHGYEVNSIDENHNWVVAMSDSIADRAGGNAAVYEMVIGMNLATGKPAVGSFSLVEELGPNPTPAKRADSECQLRGDNSCVLGSSRWWNTTRTSSFNPGCRSSH